MAEKNLRKKLKSRRGETITETLVSLLIIVLGMMMLAGSIVSAAKINRQVKDADTAFKTEITEKGSTVTNLKTAVNGSVKITHNSAAVTALTGYSNPSVINVKIYVTDDDNEYVYYEEESRAGE